MYTDVTYQDWLAAPEYDRPKMILDIIKGYKASAEFTSGLTANQYFRSDNPEVAKKTILRARKMDSTAQRWKTWSATESPAPSCTGL